MPPAKPGNKKGHTTIPRKLVPIDKVDRVIACPAPIACDRFDHALTPKNKITRHQVFEIPLPRYNVIEYQIGHAFCRVCQKTYRGQLPKRIGRKRFGIRVHAMISLLTSKFRLSKRQALSLLKGVYGIPMNIGTISNIEGRVSESLAAAHTEIKEKVDDSKVARMDETGFKHRHRNGVSNSCKLIPLTNPIHDIFSDRGGE